MKTNTKGGGMPLWPLLLSVSYIPSPVHASSDDNPTSISVDNANVTVCPVPAFEVDSLSPFACPVPTAFAFTLLDSDIAAGGSHLFCGSATVRYTAASSACSSSSPTATHVDDPAGDSSKPQVDEVIDISDEDLLNLLAAFESVQSANGNGSLKLTATEDFGCHSQRQKIAAFGIGPVRGYSVDCAVNREIVNEDCQPNANPLKALATSMIAKAESYQRATNKAKLATAKAEAEGKAHREAASDIKAIEAKMKETHQIQLAELEVSREKQAKSDKLHAQNVETEAVLERERAEVRAMREELEERLSWYTMEKWREAGLEVLRQVVNSLSTFKTSAVLQWRPTRSSGSYWIGMSQGLETRLGPVYQFIDSCLAGFKTIALPSYAGFRFPNVAWSYAMTRFNSAREELDLVVLLFGLLSILYFAWICRMLFCSARIGRHRRDEGHGDSAVVLHSPVNVAVLRQPSTTAPETNVTCTTVIIRPRSDAASVVQCRELVLASAVAKLPQPSTIAAETNETCTTVIIHPRTAVECRQLVLASAVAKLPQPSTTAAETKVTCTKVIIRPRRAVAPFIGPHHQLVASASFTAAQDEASDVAASISRAEFETPEPVANLPQPSTTAARINVTCTAVVLRLRSAAAPFDESRHSVVASASAPSTTEEEVSGSATVFKPDIDVASISSDSASHARDTPLPQLVEMTVPSLASTTLSAALETPVKMNTRVLGVSQVVKPDTEVTSQVSVLIASVPTTTAIALPPKQIVSAEASGDYSALVGPQSRSDSCGETIIVLNAHIDVPNVNLLPTEANVCTPSATNISTPEDVPVEDTACSDVIAESYEVNEVNEVNIVQSSSTSSPLRDTASRSSTSIALEAVAQVIEPALPTLTASETLDQPGRHDIGAAGSIDQHDAAIEAQQTDTSAIESTSTMTQPLASDPVTTARNEAQGVAANPSRAEPATRQHVTKSTQHSTTAVNTAVIRTSVANGPRKASPSSRSGTRLVASALASLKTNQEAAGSATLVGDTAKVDSPLTTHVRYTQLPQLVEVNAPSPASATSDAVLEAFKTNAKAKSGSKVVKRDTKVASPNATPTSSAPSAAPSALPSKPIVSAGKHADIDQPQKALRSMASETSPKAATTPAPSGSDNPIRQMNGTTHNGFHLAVLATFASIASASTSAQSPRAANHGESVAPLAKNQAGRLVSALLSKPDDQQAKGKGVDIPDPAPPAAQDPNVASTPVNTTARQVVPIDTKAKSTEAVVRDSQGVPEAQLPVQKEGPIYGEDPYAIQKSEVEAAKEGAAPAEGEPERERPKRGCRAGKRVQKARANQAQRELEAGNNVNGALES